MRIITASSAAKTTAALIPNPDHSLPGEPKQHHLACSLFTVTRLNADASGIALRLRWRHPDPEAQNAVQGALGCVVDYAARLAAQPYIGRCALSECELHIGEPFTDNTLVVTARIDGVMTNCATYECEVYAQTTRQRVLIAHSQGTVLACGQDRADTAYDTPEAPSL